MNTPSLSEVRAGQFSVELNDPSEFQILWANDHRAGVYVPAVDRTRGFLFAEDCIFEPMPTRWFDNGTDIPFHTTADQMLINLTAGRFIEIRADYEEGEIQGVTYAVDAIREGGALEPHVYQSTISEWVDELLQNHHPSEWQRLGDTAMYRFVELRLMTEVVSHAD